MRSPETSSARRRRLFGAAGAASFALGLVAALFFGLLSRHDAPPPKIEARTKPGREPVYAARLLQTRDPEQAQHMEVPPLMDEPPASGFARLKWLRTRLGYSYASMALVKAQVDFLTSLSNPTESQRKLLVEVPRYLAELEEQAARQKAEIDGFDVNAPPRSPDDPSARSGPPMKVPAALDLKADEWTTLARQAGAQIEVPVTALTQLERRIADPSGPLARVEIPTSAAPKAREEFLPVLAAVADRETTSDPAEADLILETRWEQFVTHVKELSATRQN